MLREIKIKDINSLMGSSDKKIRIEATLENQLSDEEMMGLMASSNKKIVFQKEILDNEERKYLKEVIRPFRESVTGITKEVTFEGSEAWISIEIGESNDYIDLPMFYTSNMYVGMEDDKKYTIEELGL